MSAFRRPATLSAEVYRVVRNRILSGEIAPGARIFEKDVAAELGVSRTPVREAVHRLVQEGLLGLEANRGAFVRVMSPQEAFDTYELREDLEGRAARLAAQRASRAQIRRLEEKLDLMHEVRDREYAEQINADMDFHHYIAEISGNAPLLRVIESLNVQVTNLKVYTRDLNNTPSTAQQHRALYEAIAAGDPELAQAAAREHIRTFRDLLQERLEARNIGGTEK